MAVNDRTASSRQLAARWSTATGVLMSVSSIRWCLLHRGLRERVPLYRIPLTASLELSFSRIMHAYMLQRLRDFCSVQHMQLFPWSAYSPEVSPIELMWDLVGRSLARDPCTAASKDELLMRLPAI
ncbi:transposable element Tcb1 transposase [Trichonephila clavipes]|nr:transposable element Tcb1 transposase [Trichonephila clavipes]